MSEREMRCAIYTRKSHAEGLDQAFNSLDAQREACVDYVKSQKHEGWTVVRTHYDDGGYSGATMERPALKRLFEDIDCAAIDLVVVYKVDRLSRSIGDFAQMMERFDEHGVSFVSVTQEFNTTTSMGRLTLNMLLSFAQFERDIAGERIRDKLAATRKKGMWVSGQPPLGYRLRKDGEDRKLYVIPEEAALVRKIFARYLKAPSLIELALRLNAEGHTTKRWETKWRIAIPAALAVCALAVSLPSLAVQSYPETYRKTPVPFDAISITNGLSLFASNCVACHGPQAKGNGVLAKTLSRQPVDLLTEPHTAMHTAGDFFHWLTYGRFDGIMPAFGDKLSEEDRWDVLNFLHANSRGYQARLISPRVVPDQPYMAPQNFSYSAHDGSSGTLKDFRQQKAVLLVLFSWPESRARLDQLRSAYATLSGGNTTMVLAVPVNNPNPQDMATITADMPFPVVTQGATEITRSYSLFRRTLANPDLFGEGTLPKHMEFLLDRYGYLRARWIPGGDEAGWTDIGLLMRQIDQLNREKEILPPPGDHVH